MNTRTDKQIIAPGRIENRIYFLRGQEVMLSSELGPLYGVAPRVLIQAIKRNRQRFPPHFMFQVAKEEAEFLRSQSVISKKIGRGGMRYLPYAFTEQGIAMPSSVLMESSRRPSEYRDYASILAVANHACESRGTAAEDR